MTWSEQFPATFDVGDVNAGHIHFDSSGEHFYNGNTLVYELTPAHAIFYGTDGGSVEIQPGAAGGNPAELLFHTPNMTQPGAVDASDVNNVSHRYGTLQIQAPFSSSAASLTLVSDDGVSHAGATASIGVGSSFLRLVDANNLGTVGGTLTVQVEKAGAVSGSLTFDGNKLLPIGELLSANEDRSTYNVAPLAAGASKNVTFPTNTILGNWDTGFAAIFRLTIRNISGTWAPNSCLEMFHVYREGGNAVVNYGAGAFATVGSSAMSFGPANAANGVNIQATCAADGSSITLTFKNNYADPVQWLADMILIGQG